MILMVRSWSFVNVISAIKILRIPKTRNHALNSVKVFVGDLTKPGTGFVEEGREREEAVAENR